MGRSVIGSARENQLGPIFQGVSFSSCCVLPLDEGVSRESIARALDQALGARSAEITDWDEDDKFSMLDRVVDGDAGVSITRFHFERAIAQLRIETGARRVGEGQLLLRNLFASCCLTVYDPNWASLTITIPITTDKRMSRDYHAAVASGASGMALAGLTTNQVIGCTQAFSEHSCGDSIGCEVVGGCGFCSAIGLKCGDEVVKHSGQMTLVWALDRSAFIDSSVPISALEAARSLPFTLAGIVARDDKWAEKSDDQAREAVGQHVGSPEMVADVSGDHLFMLTPGDGERRRKDIHDSGTYPAPLKALEYALYQNAIVSTAAVSVARLETDTAKLMATDHGAIDRTRADTLLELLRRVWSTHAAVLLACESRFKPWIFKYPLEQHIVDAVLTQSGTNHQLDSIRTRLGALNTLADGAHSIAAGHQLAEHQARLVEIQNTNLVSQLELRDLTKELAGITAASQRSSEKLSWLNVLIVITAAVNVVAVIAALSGTRAFTESLAALSRDALPLTLTLLAGLTVLTLLSIALTYLVARFSRSTIGEPDDDGMPYLSRLRVHESLRKSKVVSALVDEFESGYRTMAPTPNPPLRVNADEEPDLDSLFATWDHVIHDLERTCDTVYEALKKRG